MKSLIATFAIIMALITAPVTVRAGSDRFARKPRVGMTKMEVLKQYGKPDNESSSSRGEAWHYFFNKAGLFNPFAGLNGRAAQDGTVYFRSGKVRDFQWGASGEERDLHN